MSLTEAIPGMAPGSTIRNVVIALIYLPFMFLWPFIGAYIVARNRGGAAESLSVVPGIADDGGVVAGVVAFVGILVAISVLVVALPGVDDTADDGPEVSSTTDGVDSDTSDATTDESSSTDSADSSGGDETDDSTDGDSTDSDSTDGGSTDDGSTSDSTDDGSTDDSSAEDNSPPPASDGESYSFSGSGNDVTDGFESEGGLVTVAFEHDGESNFQVQAISSDGSEEYLVNDIGTYDGTVALNLPAGEWQFDVTADGSWSAGVEQPRFNQNDLEGLPASQEGEHSAWMGPIEFSGGEEVTFEITNDAQAAVWLRDTDGRRVDLLHNEIGPYEGSALVTNDGVGIITIDTDSAEWRIEIQR